MQRRLVAVLGDMEALAPRLGLAAWCQGIRRAPPVVWFSDGSRGLWRLYEERSVARSEATEMSDLDLLVEFARPVGLFGLCTLQDPLAQLLGCAVDLGTPDSLKPRILSAHMY